jgi:formiminoglutamate deiminase
VSTSFWCEWAWLGDPEPSAQVRLDVEAGRITRVAAGVPDTGSAHRLEGLTLPGFANAHSHAFHRALRGRTQSGEGSFWTWRSQMYELASSLEPDGYHDLAVQTYAEMLSAGYTTVGEFHYLHHRSDGSPYPEPNAFTEAIVTAARDAGIRITVLDALYLYGGISPSGDYLDLEGGQVRFSDRSGDAWARRLNAALDLSGATTRFGGAIHSVRAVDPESMQIVADWCRTQDAPIHIHLSEQPAENELCMAAHGRTPTGLLGAAGLLGSDLTAVHATHLTDGDVAMLGSAHATACFCPTTERDLADGIGPSRRLRRAGAVLALGSDSHAVIDALEEARALELNERLATLDRGNHSTEQLLEAATKNGYRSLGWPTGGTISEGALADFVTVEVDPDPRYMLASAVFMTTTPIRCTVVGGVIRFDAR